MGQTKLNYKQLSSPLDNRLINSNFDVWQRGTSQTITDVTLLTLADRFSIIVDRNGGTLPTLTQSRQQLSSGELANSFYFHRLNTNGAGSALGNASSAVLYQKIHQGTRLLFGAGKFITVSFWARSSIASKRLGVFISGSYGGGGTPSGDDNITGQVITLTSTFQKYILTFTAPTLAGKTFGTNNNDKLSLAFYYQWGSASNTILGTGTAEGYGGAGNIDITQIMLNQGNSGSDYFPKIFDEELENCLSYYEKSYNYDTLPGTNTGLSSGIEEHGVGAATATIGLVRFSKKKITIPTVRVFDALGNLNKISTEGVNNNVTPSNIDNVSESAFKIFHGGVSRISFHWDANAEIN